MSPQIPRRSLLTLLWALRLRAPTAPAARGPGTPPPTASHELLACVSVPFTARVAELGGCALRALPHLQVGQGRVQVRRVILQEPLLVQELAGAAPGGRLEEPVVERVLEAVVEGAEHALLGGPHGRGRVQAQALLRAERARERRPAPPGAPAGDPGSGARASGAHAADPAPPRPAGGAPPRGRRFPGPAPAGRWGGSRRRRRGRGE